MKADESFIKKLESFIDEPFNEFAKTRIIRLLKEYREEIPAIVIKEEKTKEKQIEKKTKYAFDSESVLRRPNKNYATKAQLEVEAKMFCEIYEICIEEFMNRKYRKARTKIIEARKAFCNLIHERYLCHNNTLAEFFDVHHSTVSFYMYGKTSYYVKKRNLK